MITRSVNAHGYTKCCGHVVVVVLCIGGLPGAAGDVMEPVKDVSHADACLMSEQLCAMVPHFCSHSSPERTVNLSSV